MKKFVIAAAALGVLAVGGTSFAILGADKATAGDQSTGRVTDLVISADDKNAIEVTVEGGPEGKRTISVPAGQKERLKSTGGNEYTLTATSGGKEIGDAKVPGGEEQSWDCFATDEQGPLTFGCVLGAE